MQDPDLSGYDNEQRALARGCTTVQWVVLGVFLSGWGAAALLCVLWLAK